MLARSCAGIHVTRHIIVGVDPHHCDSAPVGLGALLGRVVRAPMRVVGVHAASLPTTDRDEPTGVRAGTHGDLEALRRRVLDLGADGREFHGVPYSIEAVAGSSAAETLHDLAHESQPSVLVVGSSRRGPLRRVVAGSVTERTIRGAPCPVAIAPRGYVDPQRQLQRVGVGYVDTPEGRLALRSAAVLCREAGARLTAYTMVDQAPHGILPPADFSREELERRVQHIHAAFDRQLSERSEVVDGELVVIETGGLDELIERTTELDVLVCGSRGHRPLAAAALGGVTHSLLRAASCPLLLVPRGVENPLAPRLPPPTVVPSIRARAEKGESDG